MHTAATSKLTTDLLELESIDGYTIGKMHNKVYTDRSALSMPRKNLRKVVAVS